MTSMTYKIGGDCGADGWACVIAGESPAAIVRSLGAEWARNGAYSKLQQVTFMTAAPSGRAYPEVVAVYTVDWSARKFVPTATDDAQAIVDENAARSPRLFARRAA